MASNGKLRCMTALYLTRGDKILLLHRQGSMVAENKWTGAAGGHFEPEELNDALACVLRELREETGLSEGDIKDLRLRYVTMRHTKGEIRQNYYYFAELAEKKEPVSNEGMLKWFPLDERIYGMEMPFTAGHMLAHYIKTGRHTDAIYGGIAGEAGVEFHPMPESWI